MYKSGDFLTVHTLIEKGFYFYCWFAGYHVYKTLDDDKAIYIIFDYLRQRVVSSFESQH